MITKLILIGVFLFLGGFSRGISNILQFHYDQSIFPKMGKAVWYWNPKVSWKKKWKDGNPENGEAFLFSSSLLVFLTDGWHLFEMLQFAFYRLAMVLIAAMVIDLAFWGWVVIWVLLIIPKNFGFWLSYNKVFKSSPPT